MSALYLKKVSNMKKNGKEKITYRMPKRRCATSLGLSPRHPSHPSIVLIVIVLMAVVLETAHCPSIVMWCRGGGDIHRLQW
jgi:hypothetical protein